jgi:hypothetical protein
VAVLSRRKTFKHNTKLSSDIYETRCFELRVV